MGGFLEGVRVVELADELGEYCGKVLAGLGADVIKVEPPGGEATRSYGPFYEDQADPERSLYFWHYNYAKRGVVLDLDDEAGRADFRRLVDGADVLIDTRPRGWLADRGLDATSLMAANPGLVSVRISPFGDDGPWADYAASDLVHLALGGMMMNCGYDAQPDGSYDLPPIAPQMWQTYHIAGEVTAFQIIAALAYRDETGRGQALSCSVHDAVAKNTEVDVPNWIFCRHAHRRQTCAHSFAVTGDAISRTGALKITPSIARTKDGRWMYPYSTYLPGFAGSPADVARVAEKHGMAFDLGEPRFSNAAEMAKPENALHLAGVINHLVGKFAFDKEIWKEGQAEGLAWAPLRYPEENLADEHWAKRGTFAEIEYPEFGKSFSHVHAKWVCEEVPWGPARRAPRLGEHTAEVLAEPARARRSPSVPPRPREAPPPHRDGKPFALQGVRVIDLSWMLASAGAGRYLTAHGADVIKVEHKSRIDGMRFGASFVGPGGRAARDAANGPLPLARPDGALNRSGGFMDINAGKRGLSLNLRSERGKELLTALIRDADMIAEGFAPGAMERMGFGYERLKAINPRIIYVQQSGMGQAGTYGLLRSYGPTAQAFSGLSEMSGLPAPYAPAGIGYSYLDWFGAYQMATAMMAALYRQRTTGEGCWIDSSQVEVGLYLTGTAVLDYSANGRGWKRYGNRSPYKRAAPSGAYPVRGEDRWIAISAFDERQWRSLAEVLDRPQWRADPRFATLEARLANQDALDAAVEAATKDREDYPLMSALQAAGVPAGVCQTAQDRCDTDPQLAHLNWLVELEQAEIGRWPAKQAPVSFSETPPCVGGYYHRHGPSYGQDNEAVLRELLGLSEGEIAELAAQGVL
jgi:crotonobetainyl-CoA:carnitine CoA-transferase CaiB-like acyl-CoA transferase